MFYKVLEALDQRLEFDAARAHCDIPCGIYDPHGALIGALTVIRMIDLMTDMKSHDPGSLEYTNNMPRYIMVKEEHAEAVKRDIRVIYGDYFKQEMIDKYPELPKLVLQIMQLGSKSRQTADRQVAMDLLGAVNRFAEIFWETKGIQTKRVKAPYKPNEEMVYPILG